MIGVLALQGGFREHVDILHRLGLKTCEIRTRAELMSPELRGFVLPGGESTVMSKFLDEYDMRGMIFERVKDAGFRIYGTCAGLILLAKKVTEVGMTSSTVKPLALLDVDIERNAYGRQLSSFVTDFGAFIRAPKITRVGEGVEALRTHEGEPILVRQGSVWASTFHPELVGNTEVHRMVFGV